jgi:predicted LPLAT superfamily acyltransferase
MSLERPVLSTRAAWMRQRERGSARSMRYMAWLSLRAGRRASRALVYVIVAYFFLFGPRVRRHSLDYLARALGRAPGPLDRFRQLLYFSSCTHDRIFLLNDQFDRYELTLEGESVMRERLASGRGAILLGAHMGSFEVMRSVGRRHSLEVSLAMYEQNARNIAALFATLAPARVPEIIQLGRLEAMLEIRERIERGAFVGVLGDRTLGAEPVQPVEFLGARAALPSGPMRAAALLRCPVIFMLGLYRGANRYHVVFAPLADFSDVGPAAREEAVGAAVARYAGLLERYCRSDPYNWFNFFDFWDARGTA